MSAESGSAFALDGVAALVTGAAGGIGAATVAALEGAGASVTGVDRVAPSGGATVRHFIQSDLTQPGEAERCAELAAQRHGAPGVLVNCIGLLVPNRPAHEVPLSEWEASMAANVTAVLEISRACARRMMPSGRGAITNVTSLAELQALPNQAAYTASKGALGALTRALAIDWAPHGIRVNGIAPGPVETPMTAAFYAQREVREKLEGRIPLRRLGHPTDIANAALFLSAPASAFVTGHTLVVDGGWRAGEPGLALD